MADKITVIVREACSMTGIGRTRLYEMMTTGELPYKQCGRRRLIKVNDLVNLIDRLPQGPTPARLVEDLPKAA